MTTDIINTASIAGELAPNLYGRVDFSKYDGAWGKAENWIVDYRGGLFSRAGFEFGDVIEWADGEELKLVEFQYSPDTANTYVAVFTDNKVRFIQDNAYVLETAKNVTALANDSGNRVQFTSASHGFSNGDLVKPAAFTTNSHLNGMTLKVANAATNTLTLVSMIDGTDVEIASVTTETGTLSRIYTVASPYGQEDLERLQVLQVRDQLRMTHPDYPPKYLQRNDQTDWEIDDVAIGDRPARVAAGFIQLSKTDDDRCYLYAVTCVDAQGVESLPRLFLVTDASDMASNNKSITFSWNPVSGIVEYNVYRSIASNSSSGANVNYNMELGFIGTVQGTDFVDANIAPDFTRSPPINYNPFANGRIEYILSSNPGSGYTSSPTVTITTVSGADAVVVANVSASGSSPSYGIIVLDGGEGYEDGDTVSLSGGGTGYAGTVEASPLTGNYPHTLALYQQRLIYGATDNYPLRMFGSAVGKFDDFAYTRVSTDAEGYEFDIDAPKVAPLRHLIPVRGGVLTFTEIGIWLVFGRSDNILSGNNADSELQTEVGASYVRPVYLDSFVIYVADAGQEIRMLAYDDYSKVYGGRNVSLLSNHLFDSAVIVKSLTYAPIPSKIVYCTQSNGRLIACTIDNENSVYAITPQWSQGYFRQCLSILEAKESRLYVAVERRIGSNRCMFFERLTKREEFDPLEEAFCLDAALQLTKTSPDARLTLGAATGSTTATASSSVFVAGDVGKIIRAGDGKALITGYTSGTEVAISWQRDLTEVYPETGDPAEYLSGEWTMDATTTTVSGLWHLEGMAVTALADGEVVTGKTVSNGSITLDTAASRVVVGLPYTCRAKTLPITVPDLPIEARRKNVIQVGMRIYRTKGLKMGRALNRLKSVNNRRQVLWAEADKNRTEMVVEPVEADWTYDNELWFVQDSPRPAALLGIVRDIDVGDDKD